MNARGSGVRLRHAVFIASWVLLLKPGWVFAASPTLDMKALVAAGELSKKEFDAGNSSWTAAFTMGSVTFTYTVESSAGKERIVFSSDVKGTKLELMRLIVRDGCWYTTSEGDSAKYRPYEAPAFSPIFYLYYDFAQVGFVTSANVGTFGQLRTVSDGIATFHSDDPPTFRSVEIRTGRICKITTPKREIRIDDYVCPASIAAGDFEVDEADFPSICDDPTKGDLNDLIMFGQDPHFKASTKNPDIDGRLFNVRTRQSRRIPFHGYTCVPVCFGKDRKSIVVSGCSIDPVGLRLFSIDLSTGENRPLGDSTFDTGFTLGGDLSADGSKLVTSHGLLTQQLYVIDMATNATRAIGKPLDSGSVHWMPDGKHLLVVHKEYPNPNEPSKNTLARMDLDGNVELLCPGGYPVPLMDGKTILFQDQDDRWRTCDWQGKNVRPYGDGFKAYGFASPSPDGKQIVFMRHEADDTLTPVVFKIGESSGTVLCNPVGLLTYPAWK